MSWKGKKTENKPGRHVEAMPVLPAPRGVAGGAVPGNVARGGKIKQQGLQISTNLLCINVRAKEQLNQT